MSIKLKGEMTSKTPAIGYIDSIMVTNMCVIIISGFYYFSVFLDYQLVNYIIQFCAAVTYGTFALRHWC